MGNDSQYDYFDSNSNNTIFKRISGGIMANFSNSTFLSTAGVVAAAAVFVFAIYSFYPSSDEGDAGVPVIKAEAVPIKIQPAQDGGMEIPFRESTVFGSAREAANTQGQIENLLEAAPSESQEPVLEKEALIAQSQTQPAQPVAPAGETLNITEQPAVVGAAAGQVAALDRPDQAPPANDSLNAPVAQDTAPKVTENSEVAAVETAPASSLLAPVDNKPVEKPMHEPASSPETLAFVRSVLDKKDAEKGYSATGAVVAETPAAPAGSAAPAAEPVKTVEAAPAPVAAPAPTAQVANGIEPAAGTEGIINGPKTHYVQLASIPDRTKADAEWAKLKSSFTALPGASQYRVEEANLGERGIYYRIQAGPYTEAQAKTICDSIKAQKPGGCLLVR